MSAIIKACNVSNTPKNTGKECDTAMLAAAMYIALQPGTTFTDTDLLDPLTWMIGLIQQRKAFPLFGSSAPIQGINNNKESDVIVTLDDGTQVFLRYGAYNPMYETTKGGLCYAAALQSFLNSGYDLLQLDISGQMLASKTSTAATYRGMHSSFMYAPSPDMADLKTTPYKNKFMISFRPEELVNNGIIFTGAKPLLDLVGLIDTDLTSTTTTQTTTNIFFGVKTECARLDLVAKYPSAIITLTNFIIKNKATGAVVTPSAGLVVGGEVKLTGTYVSGQTYTVIGSAPSIWATNLIPGYDASTAGSSVDILIP